MVFGIPIYITCFARIDSWSLASLLAEYVTCFARIGSWPLAFRAVASRPLKQILLVGKNGYSGTTYSSNDLGNLVKFPIPQVFILSNCQAQIAKRSRQSCKIISFARVFCCFISKVMINFLHQTKYNFFILHSPISIISISNLFSCVFLCNELSKYPLSSGHRSR